MPFGAAARSAGSQDRGFADGNKLRVGLGKRGLNVAVMAGLVPAIHVLAAE